MHPGTSNSQWLYDVDLCREALPGPGQGGRWTVVGYDKAA